MKIDPILNLGIDNCFASKHWTLPEQWCELIAGLGLQYIEASADTECDPLYMGLDYTEDWITRVRRACEKTGVQIANLYSGHGTYATLGLAHWDARVRARFRDSWMKRQAKTAASLGAGLGFFAHAFDESVLQSPDAYAAAMDELCRDLADIAGYAKSLELSSAGVEQMYAPHQPPWTIAGAKQMLRRIYAIGGAPFYLTDDVGHMNGQQFFLRPTEESILRDLVKKGELTVEQGKVLNEELKHSVKEAIRDNVTVHVVKPEEDLDNLDDAQLEALRQRVQAAQEKRAQAAPAQAPIKPETETEPAPEQPEAQE